MERFKVLVVSHAHPHYSKGGGEMAAHQLFEELENRPGVEALFLAAAPPRVQDAGQAFRALGSGNEIIWNTRSLPFHLGNARLSRASAELRALLEAFRPDVVNFHHYFRVGVEAIDEVKRLSPNVPVVLTLHEYLAICHRDGQMLKTGGALCERSSPVDCAACFPERSAAEFAARKRYIQRYFDQVDRFVSPSRFLIDRYVDWGIPRNKLTFIENGQPPVEGLFQPGAEALSERKQRTRFAFFGQLTQYKGIDLLLQALALMPEAVRRTVSVEINGCELSDESNPFVPRLKALLEPVQEHVVWGGPYRPAQLGRLMTDSDWVVVPSLWWENSPLVIQEAFNHGRPVICADIGGMAEKVKHLENGLQFRAGSASDLARTLTLAASKPALWNRLAANVRKPPTLEQSADRYLEVFRNLRSSPGAPIVELPRIVAAAAESAPVRQLGHVAVTRPRPGLHALFAGDFDAYARANEDDERALWFFLHIPKTAGSSFWHEIMKAKQPASNIGIDYNANETGEASRARALAGFLEELAQEPRRAARGHFLYSSLDRLRDRVDGLRLITMLRDPVDRLISDYRYSRTPAHPPYLEVIQRYPTIEHYIHAPETQNKMVLFLRYDRDEPLRDLITRTLDEYAFIGTSEFYSISRLVLFRLLKAAPRRLQRRRVTDAVAENEVRMTLELRSKIEQLNALDMELYQYFSDKWSARFHEIAEWLGAKPDVVARATA